MDRIPPGQQRTERVLGRRAFFGASAAAASLAIGSPSLAKAAATPAVCVFSKHLQFLDYDALAATCRELGVDGVDLTVRPKGHVEPVQVQRDLPRAVEAVRAAGLDVPMITTHLNSAEDDGARDIFEAASALGIRYARVGNEKYSHEGNPWDELPAFVDRLAELTALAEEHEVLLGYHNHSGYDNVGAALWDLHHIIRAIDSKHFGSNLDVGHTTVEGGFGAWQINARLIAPHVNMMAVKDFVWEGDKPRWVPLGSGVVKLVDILRIMRKARFAGPISMHFEYGTPDDRMVEELRTTIPVLRDALRDAGYTS